jgi:hypothetical protein
MHAVFSEHAEQSEVAGELRVVCAQSTPASVKGGGTRDDEEDTMRLQNSYQRANT